MAKIMYGGGLRVMEVLRLRIQDIDFGNGYLMIRDAKGGKDRTTLLAPSIIADLKQHLMDVRALFKQDLDQGVADVYLPHRLEKKYPKAGAICFSFTKIINRSPKWKNTKASFR